MSLCIRPYGGGSACRTACRVIRPVPVLIYSNAAGRNGKPGYEGRVNAGWSFLRGYRSEDGQLSPAPVKMKYAWISWPSAVPPPLVHCTETAAISCTPVPRFP